MQNIFNKLLSEKYFIPFAKQCLPWLVIVCLIALTYGLIGGLYLSPKDYQQGDAFRIIYTHVPAAFLSLFIYLFMAAMAFLALIWKIKLCNEAAKAAAPIGASMTLLALLTGSLWGKPMWGTYWIWDARLSSELILLFLYLGYLALRQAYSNQKQGDKAANLLAIVGAINIPIIHYSVYWWNTLHQGATLSKLAKPSIENSMLYPLLAMIVGYLCFFILILLLRIIRGSQKNVADMH